MFDHMFDHSAEAERLVLCFDPHASLVAGDVEHLVISPRWARLRRQHPLLATARHDDGPGAAWQTARHNLLTCRDRSIQLALSTYQHRIRIEARVSVVSLKDPAFDLHRYGHSLLDRHSGEKGGVTVRRDALWVRSLPPDPEGYARFEFGNTVQLPITEEAMVAESKTLW
jgi:hypothetical protein